jgi:UDP-glucose 4-epimerase
VETWVIGGGGLLGSAVVRLLGSLGRQVRTVAVPWADHAASAAALSALARQFPASGAEVYWCAGAGVIGSSQEQLDGEVASLEVFLSAWEPTGPGHGLFLASSAGGVYAGSKGAPFTEETVPVPISPYGHAKLAGEKVAHRFAERTGVALLVGRISNLYGPGQDITKPQGLISQLCRAELTRQPLSIYVSLDTMRDYLYADDAAAMAVAGLGAVRARGGMHLKVFASEQSTTIGAILGGLRRITRRRPPVVLGSSPNARFQVHDLRLRSDAWPPTSSLARTPLPAGMSATLTAAGSQLRAARKA